jgi:hypothetical protein
MESNAENFSVIDNNTTNETSTTTSIDNEPKEYELRNRKTNSATVTTAASNDESHNGNEFYECNIW